MRDFMENSVSILKFLKDQSFALNGQLQHICTERIYTQRIAPSARLCAGKESVGY
jgi:hypothetical protein